jgi:hypothetical protein
MTALLERLATIADGFTRALLPLVAFAAAIALVDLADWDMGVWRAGGLAAIAWALWALSRRPLPPISPSRGLVLAFVAVAILRLWPEVSALGGDLSRRGPNDIGWTTEAAVRALDRGESIYAGNIDPQRDIPRGEPGFGWYFGYKYGPVTPRYYAPFLHAFGEPRGLYAGNAVLLVLAAVLAALFARRAAGTFEAAAAAAFCVLFPGFATFELFYQGVNDLLPTVLVLAALFAAARGQGLAAGLAVGLSLACKPLPAGLYLLLLPGTVRLLPFAAGAALGLAAYLPDLLGTPRELVANLLLFNLSRPTDTTSLAHYLPEPLRPLVTLAGLGLVVLVAVAYHRGRRDAARLATAAAMLATVFLLTGKIVHRNYFLWWTPLLGAALAVGCYRAREPEPPAPPPAPSA